MSIDGVKITEKILRAYLYCARKSYLLMFSRELSRPTEYEIIIENRKKTIQDNYFSEYLINSVDFDYSLYSDNIVYKNAYFLQRQFSSRNYQLMLIIRITARQ